MLKLENLKKQYGNVPVLNGVTLAVAPGDVLAVIGPSGCGKTTLLRMAAGFEPPDAGSVYIDGITVSTPSQLHPPAKRNLSMIFQDLALWPHMTVKQHIQFVLKKTKHQQNQAVIQSQVEAVLNDVNLENCLHRRPHELSGGEKQRLAIARAIAAKPRYLLMDEPFSNLDSILKPQLQELVMRLKSNSNMGIIFVTHAVDEAIALADYLAVMNQGKILQEDQKETVLKNPVNEFVSRIMGLGK